MRMLRVLAMFMAAAVFTCAPFAHADNHKDSKAYKDCYKRGQDDARHGNAGNLDINHWKHSDERQACQDGYRAGFNSISTAVATPTPLPQGEVAAGPDSARDVGYQDGLMDGRNDRSSGHSFRPTDTDNYKHADRGYRDDFGNKDSWKAAYRTGYADGYREGFKKH